jgi:hypothetical protein
MTLMYDLPPAERGLERSDESAIWTFPTDYIERLRRAVMKARPELELD